ncbi:hypothetical protein PPTG_24946 [Phytophthora nicotianae INRA-310]|uniref:Uncharacterized protein n=1 Tax=Phytophthora nicotianae (strain INRA-310) TaxID=761204 RepID=W2PBT9_PHYN3|nr:hypothetical protein PPTG_24946 [Phytophthora nicotianae INRA-310]ETM97459.1 hypothetical protein PPTG_24946 [Phytophthora nicotianae INRA-310]
MLQLLELRSLGSLGVLPGRVWRDVKDEMIREYGGAETRQPVVMPFERSRLSKSDA